MTSPTSQTTCLQRLPQRPRIALIRALQLGDVLCAVPAWRALRAAVPSAHITLISLPWASELPARFPDYLDEFLEFPGYVGIPEQTYNEVRLDAFIKRCQADPFDLAIQMHGSGWDVNDFMAELHARETAGFYPAGQPCPNPDTFIEYPEHLPEIGRHLALMEHLGARPQNNHLEFPLNEGDDTAFQALAARLGLAEQPYVCLHAGARWPSRRWPAQRYAAVGDALARSGYRVLLTGSTWEQPLVKDVATRMTEHHDNLAGQTDLGLLVRLLSTASLLISNDTGIAHLAAAARTPSVVIVLGSDPQRWAPLNQRLHRTVKHTVSCQPCEHFVCPYGHECATYLSHETVLTTAFDQLSIRRTLRQSSQPPRPTHLAAINVVDSAGSPL